MNLHHALEDWDVVLAAVEQVTTNIEARGQPDPTGETERTTQGVAELRVAGLLRAPLRFQPNGDIGYALPASAAIAILTRIGGADLSLARLYEGHLNALQLIMLHGNASQRRELDETTRGGAFYGVWGADGFPGFTARTQPDGTLVLSGTKRYASGLGLVTTALVPFKAGPEGMRMLLIDAEEPERRNLTSWNMRGMAGSRSGTYDFEGIVVDAGAEIGKAGDYQKEPHFVGGIWRCAAAQLGAIERLVTLLVEGLNASNRFDHPLQTARVGEAIMAARTARLWIEDAARRVESATTPDDIARAVSLSAFARLQTEAAGMTVINLVERGIGLSSFAHEHAAEALGRDLAVYLRQANPDAVLLEHARVLAAQPLDL